MIKWLIMKLNTARTIFLIISFFCLFSCKKTAQNSELIKEDILNIDTAQLSLPLPIENQIDSIIEFPDSSLKIVILGSSTSAGNGASSLSLSWVNLLRNKVRQDSKNVDIINLSVPGYNTFHILPNGNIESSGKPSPDIFRNITKAISYRPNLIIINMPTNDVASGFSDDQILANYTVLVNLMKSNNINYMITGTQPRNFGNADMRKRLKILNDKMNNSFPGHVVDYLQKLSKNGWFILEYFSFGDDIHLNDRGHRIIFQYIINFPIFKKVVGYQ